MANADGLNRRMTSLDASFLYLEQPNALLHVAGIYTFAHQLDYASLLRYVRERLDLIPRYTQRAVMVPLNLAHPTWEEDPDFDIHQHVLRHRLKSGHDDAALATLCAKLFAEPLDRSRPLWEMHLIEGYRNGCAMLAKTHHAMIDGASGVQLINLLMDPTPKPATVEPLLPRPRSRGALPNPLMLVAQGLLDTARTQLTVARQAAGLLTHPARAVAEGRATVDAVATLARTLLSGAPPTLFNGPIGRRRALAWTRLSLNEVKATKNRLGGTVNDVVLAVISGALRTYLQAHSMKIDRTELKAMVPVNVRSEHDQLKLGNRVSMMVAPLPIGITDPIERLRQVSAAMDLLKSGGQASQMERVVALTDLLPPLVQRPLARLQASVSPVNTVCTNVPGPRETRYLLGEPVQLMVPLVPLAAGIGLGFAIMSYADQLTIGLNADAERVADIWTLAEALSGSFEELWAATGLERIPAPSPAVPRARKKPAAARSTRSAESSSAAEAATS
ncbi:MAG TPA: wax ester/triacylglycerol synthase family O-acyltransferase [Candidatus Margulisiibacteriota bacterium]|nr:wax ester/triacylglycerol synthase family O-acyltransferase [Candidatus Margulisiibacteriota bacterium]